MMMLRLIENESLKILRRRRFAIILAIMAAVLCLVAYGYYRQLSRNGQEDWRVVNQQRLARYESMIRRGRISESWARSLKAEIARVQYHLDHDINPDRTTAPDFTRRFAAAAGYLLLPLLISVLGSDIVSAEASDGTDKFLLTRPVKRWKILFAKLMTLYLFTTLTLVAGAVLSFAIGSVALDHRGWGAPVFAGFELGPEGMNLDSVRQLPLWQDTVISYGLEWFALISIASIALMLSIFFRSSAGSIGTMLAALIAGTILTRMSPDWTAAKYLFVSGIPLAAYYSGQSPPYDGMTLEFCIGLLGIWASAAIIIAFAVYTRRDVFG